MIALIESNFATWLLLLMFVSGTVLMLLVLAALAFKWPGFAVVAGGAFFFGLLALGSLFFGIVAPASSSVISVTAGSSIIRALSIVVLLAIIAMILYHAKSPADRKTRRWWPAVLIPLLLGLYFLSSVRVEKRLSNSAGAVAQQMASGKQQIARQLAEFAHRTNDVNTEVQPLIARMDIHALMDKADAPRIALPPDSPAAPEAPGEASPAAGASTAAEESTEGAEQIEPTAETAESPNSDDAADESEADDVASAADSADASTTDVGTNGTRNAAEVPVTAKDGPREETESRAAQLITAKRPPWVDDRPKRVGQVWREVVETDQYATMDECYRASDVLLQIATYDHLARLVGIRNYAEGVRRSVSLERETRGMQLLDLDEQDGRLYSLRTMGIGIDFIRREIAKDEFLETTQRSFGPMTKLYTLIEFSQPVDRELRARWEASRRGERIAVVGAGAASMLGLLGVAWGLLKADTLTRGYYTKRLFLGVPAAIIGITWLLWYIGPIDMF